MILHVLNLVIWLLLAAVVVWPVFAWLDVQRPTRHFHLEAFAPGEMIFTPPDVEWPPHVDPAAIYKKWNMKATPYHEQFTPGHDERPSTVVHRRPLNIPPDLRTSVNRRCRYANCADQFPCQYCQVIR